MTLPALKKVAGHPWLALGTTDSTNDEAWKALEAGRTPGLVVTAQGQTAGRGREGRAFHSPPGGGLWASITAATRLSPSALPAVTVAASVAAAEVLRELSGLGVSLRWPNDLMAGPRKLGGVLAESRGAGDHRTLIVLGLGINLSMTQEAFPAELKEIATSVALEGGRIPAPEALLKALLPRFDRTLASLESGGAALLLLRWSALCRTLGRRVTVQAGGETLTGKLKALSLEGFFLETSRGLRTLAAGHVTHLREL